MKRAIYDWICLFFVLLTINAAEQAPTISIPAGDNIFSALKKTHPRLLASEEDSAHLREAIKTNALLKTWYGRIQQRAEGILTQAPSRYEIPDGLRLLETSRRVLDRVYMLALVYRMTQDQRFADRAWKELDAAAHFPDWNHSKHFLDTAEMTHAFAIGYDWLYSVWTPEQREAIRTAILTKGLEPGLEGLRKKVWWAESRHNWNQVCNGGLGMGALAIADEQPKIAGELLHRALVAIQLPMAEFAPDGAWGEGPGYWDYATSYNVTLLAALDSAVGTDFGLSKIPAFSETGSFPLYLNGTAKRSFNFADGGDGMVRGAQLFCLGRKFDRPEYSAFERTESNPTVQDLIWFDPQGDSKSLNRLPLDKYYRNVELAVFRGDWQNPGAVYVGLKAGDNAVNHSHLDLGSFVLDALEERWAIDFGHEDYNLPGYFGKERWNYYRLRAEGHNTLVLNPNSGADQETHAVARIIRFKSQPERAFAIADLTPAYSQHAQRVQRGMAVLNRKEVLVQDEIHAQKEVDLWWFVHTSAEIKTNGQTATLKLGNKFLSARILAPADANFTVMKAEPLPSSPHPEKQANNDKFKKLTVHLPNVKDVRLVVLFTPGLETDKFPAIESLDQW